MLILCTRLIYINTKELLFTTYVNFFIKVEMGNFDKLLGSFSVNKLDYLYDCYRTDQLSDMVNLMKNSVS